MGGSAMIQVDCGRLRESLEPLGIGLSKDQEKQFDAFGAYLYERNETCNLTRIGRDEFVEKHLVDSLALVTAVELSGNLKLIDVGTGAGFPAIPLAISFPSLSVTALDSTCKKLDFIEEVAQRLGLSNLRVVHGRAEEMQRKSEHRARYDIAVARAVAPLYRLAPWLLPFVAQGGVAAALKGSSVVAELDEYRQKNKPKKSGQNTEWPDPSVATISPSRTIVVWQMA
jgi:16S rRNA (guanine527-N7)-methyltransferase